MIELDKGSVIMKTEKNIFIAFILNLLFSIIEFFGGFLTNSIAIISDSIHDFGDSLSIGISYFLEKKSKRKPDNKYTYGYMRYSLLGSTITTLILLIGSILVIYNAITRIIKPIDINYNGMIILSIVGVIINILASYFTHEGNSLNLKAVNLHMIEDVLGWIIVLVGSIIMKFTGIKIIDPILSIVVALFIIIQAIKNIKIILNIFLEKVPKETDIDIIKEDLLKIDNIIDIHHIHVWSIDGYKTCATLHVVLDKNYKEAKNKIRAALKEFNITHVTIEIETKDEKCCESICITETNSHYHHHH